MAKHKKINTIKLAIIPGSTIIFHLRLNWNEQAYLKGITPCLDTQMPIVLFQSAFHVFKAIALMAFFARFQPSSI